MTQGKHESEILGGLESGMRVATITSGGKLMKEITVWIGRDKDGDFAAGGSKSEMVEHIGYQFDQRLSPGTPTAICRKNGLGLGLHRIVKKGEVARVTFTARVAK